MSLNTSTDRGNFLIILTALTAFSLLVNIPKALNPVSIPLLLGYILQAVSLYGIWTWKKWGIYLLFASFAIGAAISIFSFQVAALSQFAAPTILIGYLLVAGLWIWAASRKWHLFR